MHFLFWKYSSGSGTVVVLVALEIGLVFIYCFQKFPDFFNFCVQIYCLSSGFGFRFRGYV